jgi:CheY-like chemotaxis protein
VVDDEPENVDVVVRILGADFACSTFTSAEQAFAALMVEPFDLIIADQRMPGMTGVELLRRARLLQPQARRVILSGQIDAPGLVAAINEGQIHRILAKPVGVDELSACARSLTAGCLAAGTWLVVDDKPERGGGIAEILDSGRSGGGATRVVKAVEPTPELELVLLVKPEPAEVERVVHGVGGPAGRVMVMVAAAETDGEGRARYLRAGASEVFGLPMSAMEFSLRYHMLSSQRQTELVNEQLRAALLSHQGAAGDAVQAVSDQPPADETLRQPAATKPDRERHREIERLLLVLAEEAVAQEASLPELLVSVEAAVLRAARARFGVDLAGAKRMGIAPARLLEL